MNNYRPMKVSIEFKDFVKNYQNNLNTQTGVYWSEAAVTRYLTKVIGKKLKKIDKEEIKFSFN
jgi:hypothetical protein